jgi:nucleoside-diphosphate-sugar epimerase
MRSIFLTGFPGFLGTRLVRTLADQYPEATFRLLIQPKFNVEAEQVLNDLGLTGRATLLPGDITEPGLGLGGALDALQQETTHAFHLAAVYDLSIPRAIGWTINVDGTRNVLDALEACENLALLSYVSTAYVSGKRTGIIYEDELVHGDGFKNYYEETKYHAEVLVQDRMSTLPAVIFRPGIVVGDSQTGETSKFDGPYFILQALRKLPKVTFMTKVGSGNNTVNLVPVDFVIEAMTHLAQAKHAGTVFHLTDPHPMTTQKILELFTDLMEMRAAFVPVPPKLARTLMQTGLGQYLGISPELIDYFDHPSRYDCSNTLQALEGTGIACPPLIGYAHRMIEYLKTHRDIRATAMY